MKRMVLALLIAGMVGGGALRALSQETVQNVYDCRTLAMVGDKVITSYDVELAAVPEFQILEQSLSGEELEKAKDEARARILDSMIDYELAYLEFKAAGAKLPQAAVQERINRIIIEKTQGNPELFEDALFKENLTRKEFTERVYKDMAVEAFVYDRVRRGIVVSDQEIEDYFQKHRDDAPVPAKFRVQVIALQKNGKFAGALDETVAAILKRVDNGDDFSSLAREFSEGAAAGQDGDLGWRVEFAPKLQAVVDTLKKGQVARKPLEMGNALYIVKLADFQPASKPVLDAELKGDIRKILQMEKEKERYQKCFRELYMKHPVVRMN